MPYRITGCGTGIGRATAIECAKHGARLILHHKGGSKSEEDIDSLQSEIEMVKSGTRMARVAVDVVKPEAGQTQVIEAPF